MKIFESVICSWLNRIVIQYNLINGQPRTFAHFVVTSVLLIIFYENLYPYVFFATFIYMY